MSSVFSGIEIDAIHRDTRAMSAAGLDLAAFLSNLQDEVGGMTAGSTALGVDIDSLALGGGAFTVNTDTTSGLTLGYNAGRIFNGFSEIVVAAGTILLAASNTNYVEVDNAGVVHTNTSGFTAGRMPLYTVATGVSSIPGGSITSFKSFLSLIGPRGCTGAMLSAAGATKEVNKDLSSSIAATTSFQIISPNVAATINKVEFATSANVATSDASYWTFALVNLGPAGSGSTAVLDPASDNTTKATGGAALVSGVARSLTLDGTPSNLNTAANDVLLLTITMTGTPTALTLPSIRIDFTFAT